MSEILAQQTSTREGGSRWGLKLPVFGTLRFFRDKTLGRFTWNFDRTSSKLVPLYHLNFRTYQFRCSPVMPLCFVCPIQVVTRISLVAFVVLVRSNKLEASTSQLQFSKFIGRYKKLDNFGKTLHRKLKIGLEDILLTQNTLLKNLDDCIQIEKKSFKN